MAAKLDRLSETRRGAIAELIANTVECAEQEAVKQPQHSGGGEEREKEAELKRAWRKEREPAQRAKKKRAWQRAMRERKRAYIETRKDKTYLGKPPAAQLDRMK